MSRVVLHGKFAAAPAWLIRGGFHTRSIQVWLLLYLEAYEGDTDAPAITHQQLADTANCSVTTIKSALAQLSDWGALKVVNITSGRGKEANEYHLTMIPGNFETAYLDSPSTAYSNSQPPDYTSSSSKNIKNYTPPTRIEYPPEWEEIWDIYPFKRGVKQAGYDKYQKWVAGGTSHEALLSAVRFYADKVKREQDEEQYVLRVETFFGPNARWTEYDGEQKAAADTPVAEVECPTQEEYDAMVALAESGQPWYDVKGREWSAKSHPGNHYPQMEVIE